MPSKTSYVKIACPGCPDGACIEPSRCRPFEHRYVMAQHLNRPLLSSEHVHHINGDRGDNRLSNLMLVSSREHMLEHWAHDWADQHSPTLWCDYCGLPYRRLGGKGMLWSLYTHHYCCRACRDAARRLPPPPQVCPQCQQTFIPARRLFNGQPKQFCSRACRHAKLRSDQATLQASREITCKACGTRFYRHPKEQAQYCSRRCYGTTRTGPRVERVIRQCQGCGADFALRVSGDKTRFCSRACAYANRSRNQVLSPTT